MVMFFVVTIITIVTIIISIIIIIESYFAQTKSE
jgi:hypothetical protein